MRIGPYDYRTESFLAHSLNALKVMEDTKGKSSDSYTSHEVLSAMDTDSYWGSVPLPDGTVCMIPYSSGNVGIFNPVTNVLTKVPAPSTSALFRGGCVTDTGTVVMAPLLHSYVGIYDLATGTYRDGPEVMGGEFDGACQAKSGVVVLSPRSATHIGLFDPVTETFSQGPAHGAGSSAFSDAVPLRDGRVMLVNYDSDKPFFYDPATNALEEGPTVGTAAGSRFAQGVLLPNGDVVLVPYSNNEIVVYRQESGTFYTSYAASSFPSFSASFIGGALAPDGRVFMAALTSQAVGVYDPRDDTYSEIDGFPVSVSGRSYGGIATTTSGQLVMAPRNSDSVVVFEGVTGGVSIPHAVSRYWARS